MLILSVWIMMRHNGIDSIKLISGTRLCVNGWSVPDTSKDRSAFVFSDEDSARNFRPPSFFWNDWNRLTSDASTSQNEILNCAAVKPQNFKVIDTDVFVLFFKIYFVCWFQTPSVRMSSNFSEAISQFTQFSDNSCPLYRMLFSHLTSKCRPDTPVIFYYTF
jgi:hypothetical protein